MHIYFKIRIKTEKMSLEDQIGYFEDYLKDLHKARKSGLKSENYIIHEPLYSKCRDSQMVARFHVVDDANFTKIQDIIIKNNLHTFFIIFVDFI